MFWHSGTKDLSLPFSPFFRLASGLVEFRNAVSKETLRHHLLTSSAEALPHTGSSLLSCFTKTESKPQLQERLSAVGEALPPCSENALYSWFDPLEITLDENAATLTVRFPHAFFGLRFASLFQKVFERKARELWGKNLAIVYGAGKLSPTPPPAHAVEPAVHPAVANPTPFGEEWTFDTFIGNGKHKWALSLTRDITSRAVYRAAHGRLPASDGPEVPGLLVLCGPHGTGKTHLLRAVGNELFRSLGSDLYYASLSDLELLFTGPSPLAARQDLFAKEALLLDDFQHLRSIPDKVPVPLFRAQPLPEAGPSLREELCLLLDRFMDQGKPVILAGEGRPKDWNPGKALFSRLETGLWAELPEPDLEVRLRYAQQQTRLRRMPLSREHLMLIAQHCPDIRRLSGIIRRADSSRSLLGHELSEQDLLNIMREGGEALTPQIIIGIVGERCGVPPKEILGEKRRPDLVRARQLAMYLCRELLGHSYPVIGRQFGGKDHSTVMHGVKKIKLLQERDRLTHSLVTELTKACLERRS